MSVRLPSPSFAARLACLVALVCLTGCLVDSQSRSQTSGRYVSEASFEKIMAGQKPGYVVALCGQPSRKNKVDDNTMVWCWDYEKTTQRSGRLVVLRASKRSKVHGTVFVEFTNGIVSKKWRQTRKDGEN